MNCKHCGAEMDAEMQVCPICGKDQAEMPQQQTEAVAAEVACDVAAEETKSAKKVEKETKKGKKPAKRSAKQQKKLVKMITVAVVCVLLVFFLVATICESVGISIHPGPNTTEYKKSYTVSDSVAAMAKDRVVATIGDKELTNGELQTYYWMQCYNFINSYSSYLSSLGLDTSKPLDKQYVSDLGITWEQYFLDIALQNWHKYQSLQLAAEAAGYELGEDVQKALDEMPEVIEADAIAAGHSDFEEYMAYNAGTGSTKEGYLNYQKLYTISLEYYKHLYNSVEPTDEEIETCFDDNAADFDSYYGITKESGRLVDVRHILIYPESSELGMGGKKIYTDSDWEECRKKAQQILDEWKSGEATEESFAKLANEVSEDPGSNTAGGLYSFIYEGQMVDAFEDWCFEEGRQYGDTGLVRTEYGYHIMFYVFGDEGWRRYAKDVLAGKYSEEQVELYKQTYPMEVNFRKIVIGQPVE